MPVLREGKRRGAASRATALPAPLHLALVAAALPRRCRRASALAAVRAATGAASGSTRTTRRSTSRPSAAGCARTASRPTRSTALWNLIALPTLNLPADDASLAAAVKVFRTGLLDAADAADIGVPAVPLQRLHGDAAAAALERAGARVCLGTPVARGRAAG